MTQFGTLDSQSVSYRRSKLLYTVVRTGERIVRGTHQKGRILVNASSYPTRARVRKGTHKLCRIDRSFRFVAESNSVFDREQMIRSHKAGISSLSPATQRVLNAVRRALLVSYDAKRGYLFASSVNRAAIAQELGRSALVPYDIRMLRALAAKHLVVESRAALPRKQYGDIWLGAGAEFVYGIPDHILFVLLALDPDEKDRLAVLIAQGKAQAAQDKMKAQLAKDQARLAMYKPQPVKKERFSLLERIVDLLSW